MVKKTLSGVLYYPEVKDLMQSRYSCVKLLKLLKMLGLKEIDEKQYAFEVNKIRFGCSFYRRKKIIQYGKIIKDEECCQYNTDCFECMINHPIEIVYPSEDENSDEDEETENDQDS